MLTTTLAVAMVLASGSAEAQVEEAMRPVVPVLRGCFIARDAPSARAVLRFAVGPDGSVLQPRLEDSTVRDTRLGRCLLSAVSTTSFPESMRGREVAYPVRYQAPTRGPAEHNAAGPRFRMVQSPRPVGDSWMVVHKDGRPVSDLDLALAAGATELHTELTTSRTTYIALAVGEGVVAAAALGVAGYGAHRIEQFRDEPRRRDQAMVGGGLLAAGVAGGLMLFHTLRAIDTSVGRPVWHHLNQETARRLVDGD